MRHLLLFIMLWCCSVGAAQSRLREVHASPTGTGVLIQFSILEGAPCQGYSIWHRPDSLSPYTMIHDNGGQVCGEAGGNNYFTYVHTSPAQERTNYYKVQIDFPQEYAERSVYVSAAGKSGMTIYPNPIGPNDPYLNLRLTAGGELRLVGELYDRFGVFERDVDVHAISGLASMPLQGLRHGVYMLWLTDGTNVYSGKVIVSP